MIKGKAKKRTYNKHNYEINSILQSKAKNKKSRQENKLLI